MAKKSPKKKLTNINVRCTDHELAQVTADVAAMSKAIGIKVTLSSYAKHGTLSLASGRRLRDTVSAIRQDLLHGGSDQELAIAARLDRAIKDETMEVG